MASRAVYPGTFDPLTRGHEDLVRRAALVFEELIVGVADSRGKQPFFTLEERVAMARDVLSCYTNVRVHSFRGLLMNFIRTSISQFSSSARKSSGGRGRPWTRILAW